MTAKEKEKAGELAQKMFNVYGNIEKRTAIECSLIAVDEILKLEVLYSKIKYAGWNNVSPECSKEFWENVKKEIEQL